METRYGYEWKTDEAEKMILRTHTTAISSNMLYQLAQEKEFRPVKWFSIDRVFRNETLDATHLAEFHQIEGVVADRGIALGDLMGVLHGFFKKLGKSSHVYALMNRITGIKNLRFKPAYNPYTEPSMEIFAWHEGLNSLYFEFYLFLQD
jgi:phenylalanyl-tRNA synthetase alpha chain